MNPPKKYPCKECGKEVIIRSKGLCPLCRSLELNSTSTSDISYKKPKNVESKQQKARKEKRDCLSQFFKEQIELLAYNPYCRETGVQIIPSSFSVCHILPKRNHQSVQCHPDNVMFLHVDVHSRFDRLLDEHRFSELTKMNIWPIVKFKLERLLPELKEVTKLGEALKDFLYEINAQK